MIQNSNRKLSLLGLDRNELMAELEKIGEKPFRAKQLWHWIYYRGETDFTHMTTIAKSLQEKLSEHFVVGRPQLSREQTSKDSSHKWLFKFDDGNEAETVFIPDDGRGALCLSSQIGCTLTCTFCHTGTQRLVRNLSTPEIVGQLMLARDSYGEWPSSQGERLLSNIVMMGMGEPLFNYENVAKALHIIMDGDGISISKRRITLSTSGVVPLIRKCGAELGVNLAISLHAVSNQLRDKIMPINKKYPLKELLQSCREYPGSSNARRITFEYVMLKGINDSPADARELVRLVKGIPAKFNLIPFNKWPGAEFDCSEAAAMKRFSQILNDGGYSAPIRVPRGRDILAACGQLKSASETEQTTQLMARKQTSHQDGHHS
jgi:23S rRNA (adenine2503-C2)-methyltransferase